MKAEEVRLKTFAACERAKYQMRAAALERVEKDIKQLTDKANEYASLGLPIEYYREYKLSDEDSYNHVKLELCSRGYQVSRCNFTDYKAVVSWDGNSRASLRYWALAKFVVNNYVSPALATLLILLFLFLLGLLVGWLACADYTRTVKLKEAEKVFAKDAESRLQGRKPARDGY